MDMDALLCRLDLSAARNFCRGSSRNSRAMAVSRRRSRWGAFSGRGSSDTTMALTTSSNCSKRGRLGMAALHSRSQSLERAQLQLLDGSLAFAKPLRDFPAAAQLGEAPVNDELLTSRQPASQS